MIGRRTLVVALTVATGVTALSPRTAMAAPDVDGQRLALPAPGGEHAVGTTSLHLVDGSRPDPLAPAPRARELMVRLWYPAIPFGQAAAYMPAGQAAVLIRILNEDTGAGFPADLLTFPTNSRLNAPADTERRRPVLLFSPGLGSNIALYTGLFDGLAGQGYVVAAVDHTFDAPAVEFPDGRVEVQNPDAEADPDRWLPLRAGDVRFVLDRLAGLAGGHNPDAGHRPLPRGLGRVLDLTRVGAFGHSLGSRTVVRAVEADRRIDTGAALDGNPLRPARIDRPFLMLGNPAHRRAEDPDWAGFYDELAGVRRHLVVDGLDHNDFSDLTIFKHAIGGLDVLFLLGPIDGRRALTIQRRYLTAWFDQTLLGRPNPLLDGESPRFPEVGFQP